MPHDIDSKLCVGAEHDHGIYVQYVDGFQYMSIMAIKW